MNNLKRIIFLTLILFCLFWIVGQGYTAVLPECNDNLDNDGDGETDSDGNGGTPDAECDDANDDHEGNNPSDYGESRFFDLNNTWYEPVPASPSIHANSANYVSALDNGIFGGMNNSEWGLPIFRASGGEATVTVAITTTNTTQKAYIEAQNWNDVPIPVGSEPAGNATSCGVGTFRDGHMTIVSADGNTAWDFYQAEHCVNSNGTGGEANKADPTSGYWRAKTVRQVDLTGNGINYPYDNHGTQRAATTPLLQGVITYDEVANGVINHAIAFYHDAYLPGNTTANNEEYPNGVSNSTGYYRDGTYTVQLSMRFQLDPTFDCSTITDNFEEMVCIALQKYGMIFVDSTGDNYNYLQMEDLSNDITARDWTTLGVDDDGVHSFAQLDISNLRLLVALQPPFTAQGECANGEDDDGDSLIDTNDTGCTSAYGDATEATDFVPDPPDMELPANDRKAIVKGRTYDIKYTLPGEDGSTPVGTIKYDTTDHTGGACAGTTICTDLGVGYLASCSWDTTGLASGKYYICGSNTGYAAGAQTTNINMPHPVRIFECPADTTCIENLIIGTP